MDITPYLDDLESRIDADTEDRLMAEWVTFVEGAHREPLFAPTRSTRCPPRIEWPEVTCNEGLLDQDLLVLKELKACSDLLAAGGGHLLAVRSNYGIAILPSLFGAEVVRMDDGQNTLPTARAVPGGAKAVRCLLDKGAPEVTAGYGGQVYTVARRYLDMFSQYPNISRYVHIYHPDFQGPIDVCEVVWGSQLFYDLVDAPDLVHRFLDMITTTYVTAMEEWFHLLPPGNGTGMHWGMLHKGHIMLRDDSAMNLSPDMFDEFVRPYDQRCLDSLGGGAIHFCGRGSHYIASMCEMKGLHAIQMSQPHLNDMERVFAETVDRGIALLGFSRPFAEETLARGRDLRHRVHVGSS